MAVDRLTAFAAGVGDACRIELWIMSSNAWAKGGVGWTPTDATGAKDSVTAAISTRPCKCTQETHAMS